MINLVHHTHISFVEELALLMSAAVGLASKYAHPVQTHHARLAGTRLLLCLHLAKSVDLVLEVVPFASLLANHLLVLTVHRARTVRSQ